MDSVDFTMLQAVFWYVIGIFSYRIISKLLNIGHAALIFNEALLSSLSLLKNASDNYEVASDFNHKKTSALKKDYADQKLESDRQALQLWQRIAIANIINSTPVKLKSVLDFKDWSGAMRYLKKGIKDV
jgi:hypothetical protein